MNFCEAMFTGKPFTCDLIIGGYVYIDGVLYHRDNINDLFLTNWLRDNCSQMPMVWLTVEQLSCVNWRLIQ